MENRFTEKFGCYVCPGDSISTEVDGLIITATVEYDQDSGPPDEECDGFWPSLDPGDVGYIGDKSKSALRREHAHMQHVMDSWRRDEWFYCGIVLSVSKDDVVLDDHAASLWCIEANYPCRLKRDRAKTNDYLNDVADELLGEAINAGRAKLERLAA